VAAKVLKTAEHEAISVKDAEKDRQQTGALALHLSVNDEVQTTN
jgi:hypothetical protein